MEKILKGKKQFEFNFFKNIKTMSNDKMESISSDEINLLIQYYLQELGYNHAAFAFGCESQIPEKISKRKVLPGSLVYLIQKGIMFTNMEAAAEKALDDPVIQFAHQLNLLRDDLNQNMELVDELCASTRLMKTFLFK